MKPCPYCHSVSCAHIKKFFGFGLAKILIIQKSFDATLTVFSALATFLPTTPEVQYKINQIFEDLRNSKRRLNDIRSWYETKIVL